MIEALTQAAHPLAAAFTALSRTQPYHGPERRLTGADATPWLPRMLDEIDYGMLLVTAEAQVTYLNHAARLALDSQHPLQLWGRALRAHRPQDVAPLFDALAAAQRGLRRLLTMGDGDHRISVSVVPLPHAGGAGVGLEREARLSAHGVADEGPLTLLMLGKRRVCAQLSVQGYARSVGLTPTESCVLEMLCGGVKPSDIAARQGVAVCTVRTQIGSIRGKTGAASIRALVQQLAVLPPMESTLGRHLGASTGRG